MSDTLSGFSSPTDPDLLVGFETSDDAAVYRMNDELAMVNTIDFITPPVDDPYWYGQVAAANSLSDVYAMGATPLTALNVVMFPSRILDMGLLREILKGGNDKVVEAGAVVVGGHTVDDEEPKYGLSVTGRVHPDRILTNAGASPGDALILTKPLGSGVLFNAVHEGKYEFERLQERTLPIIASLNGKAVQAALPFEPNACTDVTGFGILGHALEMACGSGCAISLDHSSLPWYDGALAMSDRGVTTGSNKANRELSISRLTIRAPLTRAQTELLFDPQTSGGLLLAIPQSRVDGALKAIHQAGTAEAAIIGRVEKGDPSITVW